MQKHSFAHKYLSRQDKTGPTKKKVPTLKKNITMVELLAWSSGMAIVLIANPSRQPLCNGRGSGGKMTIFSNGSFDQCKYPDPLIYTPI
jgi:hypothetical protein